MNKKILLSQEAIITQWNALYKIEAHLSKRKGDNRSLKMGQMGRSNIFM